MITLKRLKELFEAFDHPFLPKRFVDVKILDNDTRDPVMNIRIGDRDLLFTENGDFVAQGTNVGNAVEWDIKKVESVKKKKK